MDGWQRLGANMFGNSDAAYQQGVNQGLSLESKMLDARKKRDEEVARGQFMQKLVAMGETPERADAIATWQIGGGNPGQLAQAMLGMQEHGQRGQLWDRASQPGATVAGLNPLMAALQGKPVDLTQVAGGVAYNPMATPDMAQMMTTPVGDAQIQAQQARVVAQEASANRANAAAGAQAALARLRDKQTEVGGYAPRAQKAEPAGPMTGADDPGMAQFFDGSAAVPQRVDLGAGVPGVAPAAVRKPAVGTIEQGYRFKGGDPSNPASWEPVG
jgi:hypothetical protein